MKKTIDDFDMKHWHETTFHLVEKNDDDDDDDH